MIHTGDTIGPYTIVSVLGRGAFGEVWLAERRSSLLTTQVALKLPLDANSDLDAIRSEAQIWLRASGHPNIVPVLDAEVYEGQVVIASEYVAGGSLADWQARHNGQAPSVAAAVNMVRGILEGLQHLHEAGLIHRDLKPGNILVQKGKPRLTDFGLTRVLKQSGRSTNLAGTPAYMAPEAFKGHYSAASDVWAAGLLLHELLAGTLPYPDADFYPMLLAITSEAPVALSDKVPDALRPVLERALAKPLTERFSTAAEMLDAVIVPPSRTASTALTPTEAANYVPMHSRPHTVPSGSITFLFTDIEGSTKLWERYPEAMRTALPLHDRLMRAAIEKHRGYVFKTVGDAFCAAFPTVTEAVNAALEAQTSLLAQDWGDCGSLHDRMALHTGEAEERDHDYFGQTLSRVARLLSIAHGRQILLSQATYGIVRNSLPARAGLRDLGTHRLKDLTSPEQVWQLLHPDLPEAFSPLRSLDYLPTNLPAQTTSFVGRDRAMVEVRDLLSKHRLLTLTGSGGTGKTRLLLQVAAEAVDDYADGVWLVELAPLSDPAHIPQAVATVLEVREERDRPLTQTLIQAVKHKKLLLLLDNCEHVLDAAAALVDTLLRHSADLKILATSREGLGAPGEQTYRVPSLSLPNSAAMSGKPAPEEVLGSEAARLFAERAALLKADFAVTNENAAAVARLCCRLDGIPLAIELAAARVRSLPVEQIEARLHDRFRLLTGGSRTALPRQQTLRALIDWSYDLLGETEKALLLRLSVFAGGWSLEAAERVCAGEIIEDWEVLDLLTALVDKSLVVYEEQRGEARYRLLETVRQYARDRLVESGTGDGYRCGHRDYFLAVAEEAADKLSGTEQGLWLNKLEAEHDNLRQALVYCTDGAEGVRKGLILGAALQPFWATRGHLTEGRERLTELLALPEAREQSKARADALNGAGTLAMETGRFRGSTNAASREPGD